MKTRILTLLPLVVFWIVAPVGAQEQFTVSIPEGFGNPGRLFIVKHTGDSADANPGDGVCADSGGNCTLRAAVDESNANNAAGDVIIFEMAYPAAIELTGGTLTLSEAATSIVGPGARRLTIRRNSSAPTPFRIFHVPNSGTRATIRGLRVEGGVAGSSISGGALRIGPGAAADLTDVWLAGNSAGTGGAISNEGTLSISRSLLNGNTANANGGALYLASGSNTKVTNSTITSNSAANGGAIYAAGGLLSVNNTITHNSAKSGASGIASISGSDIDVLNTIIGADTSLPITTITGSFNSMGSNIVTDARTATGFLNAANNDQVSDNNAIDPLLGPLANNGGQTDTRELLTNSPAIDHGNSCVGLGQPRCPGIDPLTFRSSLWDQRVPYSRWKSATVDVGAFENGGVPSGGTSFFASFTFSGWRINRAGNAMAINAVTGQRRYATLNVLIGGFRFQGLETADIHVIEIRLKNTPLSPMIFPRGF